MKNDLIYSALEPVRPTAGQRERMRRSLEEAMPEAGAPRYRVRCVPARPFARGTAVAAVLAAAAVCAGALVLLPGRLPSPAPLTRSAETEVLSFSQPEELASCLDPDIAPVFASQEELLERCQTAREQGWDPDRCLAEGLCPLLAEQEGTLELLRVDLDEDGCDELLLMCGRKLLEVYARTDTETYRSLARAARNESLWLCADKLLSRNVLSDAQEEWYFYRVESGDLVLYDYLSRTEGEYLRKEYSATQLVPISAYRFMALLGNYGLEED